MKERPIIFNGEMVRAILDGRKTQTRRAIKPQIEYEGGTSFTPVLANGSNWWIVQSHEGDTKDIACPYGTLGDRLWVRETVGFHRDFDASKTEIGIGLRAYKATQGDTECPETLIKKWIPSIHMPRWASRITLEVTDVRVQRVQEISEEDAKAEGVTPCDEPDEVEHPRGCVCNFRNLWDSINAERGYSWESNPWVWAITFKRINWHEC